MDESRYNLLLDACKKISLEASCIISCPETENEEMELNMEQKPEEILKSVFGYSEFRPLQKEVIQNVLDGRDTLAVMPTGGGKSLCYEIPALMMDGLTLVVSPLIALMQDQVHQLDQFGISAVFLNSSLDWESYKNACNRIRKGEIKLLYISPEGLNTQRMQDLLHSENVNVSCITIDEAHCISEWGHDFRPDYLEIASIRRQFPKAVCLALTATATNLVRNDIVRMLEMVQPAVLIASFNRPNLFLEVRRKNHASQQVIEFLNEHKNQRGIIYCFSRKQVDELTQLLSSKNFSVLNYHAGLTDEIRLRNQQQFIQDKVDIMVATLAFGMGINKPDVRFVIHYDMPKSLEQYYQEIGRAGRDGLNAHALMLYSYGDVNKIRYFFTEKDDPEKAEKLLQGMVRYAESRTCRRKYLLSYFGEDFDSSASQENQEDSCCDVCSVGPIKTKDVTIPSQKYLSCVLRTHQKYGATYIIDVLLGSKKKAIMDNGHNKLSTWGIGNELVREDWIELNYCLIEAGYLYKLEHEVLQVTPYGHQALVERKEISLPVNFTGGKTLRAIPKPSKKTKYLIDDDDEEGIRIVEELRKWRRKVAEELNVAPYVIFGDKTMFDIAVRKPRNHKSLLCCHGIGDGKAEKYGDHILRIVRDE